MNANAAPARAVPEGLRGVLNSSASSTPDAEPATHRRPGRKTGRTGSRKPSPLTEPIQVAEWKRGRSGDVFRVELKNYETRDIVDLRIWFSENGYRRPGRGLAMSIRQLPELALAINNALQKCRELGLLDEGTP